MGTFQRNMPDTGLMDYKARAYDPWLGRWTQPDTIVPGAANPQAWNRYGYVGNNPINATDPSGHYIPQSICAILGDDYGDCGEVYNSPYKVTVISSTRDSNSVSTTKQCNTEQQNITLNAINGDIASIVKLLTPTHIGKRFDLSICYIVGCIGGGYTLIYNFQDNKLGLSLDKTGSGSISPSFMPKFGIFVSDGPLIGWGSSNIEEELTGHSLQINGLAAAEIGGTISVSVPTNSTSFSDFFWGFMDDSSSLIVDPVYGQVPITAYFGGGVGLGLGVSVGSTKTIFSEIINLRR